VIGLVDIATQVEPILEHAEMPAPRRLGWIEITAAH
jgi:hypothetical protein